MPEREHPPPQTRERRSHDRPRRWRERRDCTQRVRDRARPCRSVRRRPRRCACAQRACRRYHGRDQRHTDAGEHEPRARLGAEIGNDGEPMSAGMLASCRRVARAPRRLSCARRAPRHPGPSRAGHALGRSPCRGGRSAPLRVLARLVGSSRARRDLRGRGRRRRHRGQPEHRCAGGRRDGGCARLAGRLPMRQPRRRRRERAEEGTRVPDSAPPVSARRRSTTSAAARSSFGPPARPRATRTPLPSRRSWARVESLPPARRPRVRSSASWRAGHASSSRARPAARPDSAADRARPG